LGRGARWLGLPRPVFLALAYVLVWTGLAVVAIVVVIWTTMEVLFFQPFWRLIRRFANPSARPSS
jgi:hypothetical protein